MTASSAPAWLFNANKGATAASGAKASRSRICTGGGGWLMRKANNLMPSGSLPIQDSRGVIVQLAMAGDKWHFTTYWQVFCCLHVLYLVLWRNRAAYRP